MDQTGQNIVLKGVNWWGINGSAFPYREGHHAGVNTHAMPYGLDRQHLDTITHAIAAFGFNAVRLPFSNEALHDPVPARPEWVGPNQHLSGKTPLEVMDAVIHSLTSAGIWVILNNHSTTTTWCCNYDFNGLWFGGNKQFSQTAEQWIEDWKMLAKRYRNNPMVIGADLRNEVRPAKTGGIPFPRNPNWGKENKKDWHLAATRAGNAIHEMNADWLIFVEGINGRTRWLTKLEVPHLKPVKEQAVKLKVDNKLVYEVHNYSFNFVQGNFLNQKKMVHYSDLSRTEKFDLYEHSWGFVLADSFKFQAPVILGEFGASRDSDGSRAYLDDLTAFVKQKNMGFFWWSLEESPASYGILNDSLNRINVREDWRGPYFDRIMGSGRED